jgi:micrococcal nuclease
VLAGVAAPAPGEAYGDQARAALQGLAGGSTVRLSYGGAAEGPYHLRQAPSRRWVQQALLEAGAVRVRTRPNDRALAREMLRVEARARQARRGLWSLPDYQVRLPQEVVAQRDEGFQLVEGRVLRAAEAGGRVFLEFSAQWRGGFSIETPAAAVPDFLAAGVELSALKGRLVRVRGEVRPTAFGPRLRLDHPEQLERLRDPSDHGSRPAASD